MPGEPFQWSVVIVGAWNIAILTPRGVSRRLFQLEEGVPVEIQAALDRPAPLRVLHNDVAVAPSPRELQIEPQILSVECLKLAATIASRAITSLPETPMSAAGVNVRYRFEEIPDELSAAVNSSADNMLADADLKINSRVLKRELKWGDGVINFEINEQGDASGIVTFNFHRQSSVPAELRAWVENVDAMIGVAKKLLTETFKVKIEDAHAN